MLSNFGCRVDVYILRFSELGFISWIGPVPFGTQNLGCPLLRCLWDSGYDLGGQERYCTVLSTQPHQKVSSPLNQSPPTPTRSLVPGSVRKGRDSARQGRTSRRAPGARSKLVRAHPPGRPVLDGERTATARRLSRYARAPQRAAPEAANHGQGLM